MTEDDMIKRLSDATETMGRLLAEYRRLSAALAAKTEECAKANARVAELEAQAAHARWVAGPAGRQYP